MRIIHNDGTWLVNTAQFRLHDPELNEFFEPGETVKIRHSGWAQAQPVIKLAVDPSAPADEEAAAKLAASVEKKQASLDNAQKQREADAQAVMDADNRLQTASVDAEGKK